MFLSAGNKKEFPRCLAAGGDRWGNLQVDRSRISERGLFGAELEQNKQAAPDRPEEIERE